MSTREKLREWYNNEQRDLPWRKTTNPYLVWISEVILQQTRVKQGMSYYERFIEQFPDLSKLAEASEQQVLKYWQGLGYYSRARNLHQTAQFVHTYYNGVFPSSFQELKKLKGIGDYTAAAIASWCYGLPHAVVDGNVYRVLARFLANNVPIDISAGKKYFTEQANLFLDKNHPGHHNQAMMELGATVCTPTNPACDRCPLQEECLAFREGTIELFPVKAKTSKSRNRYFNYLWLWDGQNTVLVPRTSKDIWMGLFEFPMIESKRLLGLTGLAKHPDFIATTSKAVVKSLKKELDLRHVLSHQVIIARLYRVTLDEISEDMCEGSRVWPLSIDLEDIPVHRMMELMLQHISNNTIK